MLASRSATMFACIRTHGTNVLSPHLSHTSFNLLICNQKAAMFPSSCLLVLLLASDPFVVVAKRKGSSSAGSVGVYSYEDDDEEGSSAAIWLPIVFSIVIYFACKACQAKGEEYEATQQKAANETTTSSSSIGDRIPPPQATMRFLTVTVTKKNPDEKVGIGYVERQGQVIVTKIREGGLLDGTAACVGARILKINGTYVDTWTAKQVTALISTLDKITFLFVVGRFMAIRAENIHCATVSKTNENKVGLKFIDSTSRNNFGRASGVVITSVNETSPFVGTDIKEGMQILSIAGINTIGMDKKQISAIFAVCPRELTLVAGKIQLADAAVDMVPCNTSLRTPAGIRFVKKAATSSTDSSSQSEKAKPGQQEEDVDLVEAGLTTKH